MLTGSESRPAVLNQSVETFLVITTRGGGVGWCFLLVGRGKVAAKHLTVHRMALRLDKNKDYPALAGVAQWTECWPVNQEVTGLIPSQGKCLGCRPGAQ